MYSWGNLSVNHIDIYLTSYTLGLRIIRFRRSETNIGPFYIRNNAVWQDDGVKIRRSKVALEAIDQNSRYRIPL